MTQGTIMGRRVHQHVPILGFALAAGCGDPIGLQLEDLAGTWDLTAFEYASVPVDPPNPLVASLRLDLIADLGGTGTVTITTAGAFTTAVTVQGVTETETGTITLDGDAVTITTGGDAAEGTVSLLGDTLTIDLTSGVEFSFPGSMADVPATVRLVLAKR